MKETILVIITILNFSVVCGQSKKIENLDLLMKEANKVGVFNGNIIISENNNIIYQNELGFTDFTQTKKLTKESTMPIGSITKEFNSAGILYLVEKEKVNLEGTVFDYLPYLPNWAEKIKIKHLLQYTSGLPRIFKKSDTEYLTELNKVDTLEFEPGTGYIYSNANIFLQEKIISKTTRLSYEDFLKNKLFKKLKISIGKLPKDSILSANMAGSFDNDNKETTFIHGGGERFFSITDLYNWINGLHSGKIISSNSLKILAKSFDKNSESSLGYTTIEGNEIIAHSHQGSGNNYEAFIYHEASNNRTIVMMTNSQNFKLFAIAEAIINILNDQPFTVPKKSIYLDIRGKLLYNFQNGMLFYKQIKLNQREKYDFSNEVSDLINTGKYLMRRNRYEDAIKILEVSTTADLNNVTGISKAFSLMGECYNEMGHMELAVSNLKKSLEFDPNNRNAEEMLNRIEKK
jgi:CubicO group peptidase (beta-lactamase class C family)